MDRHLKFTRLFRGNSTISTWSAMEAMAKDVSQYICLIPTCLLLTTEGRADRHGAVTVKRCHWTIKAFLRRWNGFDRNITADSQMIKKEKKKRKNPSHLKSISCIRRPRPKVLQLTYSGHGHEVTGRLGYSITII